MLKRPIKYEDFDGKQVVEDFYFNLTKSELLALEVSYDGGLEQALKRIIANEDRARLFAEFRKIILMAYGERSEDGKRFVKTPEITEAFSQTAAFDALFIELASEDDAFLKFVIGVLPKDMQEQASKTLAPPSDVAPVVPLSPPTPSV